MDIPSGTFEALVKKCLWGNFPRDRFLALYRHYDSGEKVIQIIDNILTQKKDVYKVSRVEAINVDSFIRLWIELHYETDFVDTGLSYQIMELYDNHLSANSAHIKSIFSGNGTPRRRSSFVFHAAIPKEHGKLILADNPNIDLYQLAKQMTLIETEMMAKIDPMDLLNYNSKKTQEFPAINDLITRFNCVSAWISSEILYPRKTEVCINMITRCIRLCQHLHELNNFNGMAEVFCGLNNTYVSRLRCMWSKISSRYLKSYDEAQKILMGECNFKKYRDILETSLENDQLIVPYIPLLMRDIAAVKENLPDFVETGINYDKIHKLGGYIVQFMQMQNYKWNIERDDTYTYLVDIPFMSDIYLQTRSAELEPKKPSNVPSLNLKQLPTESGPASPVRSMWNSIRGMAPPSVERRKSHMNTPRGADEDDIINSSSNGVIIPLSPKRKPPVPPSGLHNARIKSDTAIEAYNEQELIFKRACSDNTVSERQYNTIKRSNTGIPGQLPKMTKSATMENLKKSPPIEVEPSTPRRSGWRQKLDFFSNRK